MDVTQLIAIIVGTLGGTGVMAGAVFFLSKALVNNFLSKDLERHKSQLDLESQKAKAAHDHQLKLAEEQFRNRATIETEQLKTEMQKELHILQIRYGKYHEKRLETCAAVSVNLAHAYMAAYNALRPTPAAHSPERSDDFREARRQLLEAQKYLELNCIYLPFTAFDAADLVLQKIRSLVHPFYARLEGGPEVIQAEELKELLKAAFKDLTTEVIQARHELDDELRQLIAA